MEPAIEIVIAKHEVNRHLQVALDFGKKLSHRLRLANVSPEQNRIEFPLAKAGVKRGALMERYKVQM